MTSPVLVAAAHGTRDPDGSAVVRRLVQRVRTLRPMLDVRVGWVDVGEPSLPDVMAEVTAPSVIVPLLLSTGYHVRVDLPRAAARARCPSVIAAPLGPDPVLARLVARRLLEAGAARPDAVVLASAGSSDPRAVGDVATLARALARRLRVAVQPAPAGAAAPDVASAVTASRAAGHASVAVARYLLAPGFFADSVAQAAVRAGARWVSRCLEDDESLAALVLDRFDAAGVEAATAGRPWATLT